MSGYLTLYIRLYHVHIIPTSYHILLWMPECTTLALVTTCLARQIVRKCTTDGSLAKIRFVFLGVNKNVVTYQL